MWPVAPAGVPAARHSADLRSRLPLRPLPRVWLWHLMPVVPMTARLHLGSPVADQPVVEGQQHLPFVSAESRIRVHCVADARHLCTLACHEWVAEQPAQRVALQGKELLQLANGNRIGSASADFPLPYGARAALDRSGNGTLRQAGVLAGTSKRTPKRLALLSAGYHGAIQPERRLIGAEDAALLGECRDAAMRIASMQRADRFLYSR
jgi:hypothetical protein